MQIFDLFIYIIMGMFAILLPLLFIAKKRMDANEPIWGWRRKQYLAEMNGEGDVPAQAADSRNEGRKKGDEPQSLKELIGLTDIWGGIFEKTKNEYCIILEADSVNFDLLNDAARGSIIIGYQSLFRTIRFPVQILGQAVRQDLSRDEKRFQSNLKSLNPQARDYNERVVRHIKTRSERDFRIARRVYYVIHYTYEPSKLGQLKPEQRQKKIAQELYNRGTIVYRMLQRAKIETRFLDSIEAMEVLKRALNRDRMLAAPIEHVREGEKITGYVTADPGSLPGIEELLNVDIGEVFEDARTVQEEEKAIW